VPDVDILRKLRMIARHHEIYTRPASAAAITAAADEIEHLRGVIQDLEAQLREAERYMYGTDR
jgi:hypothetical protein